ncbi:MAG: hypothetical protein ACE5GJ_05855 [Gemmatimonadota bacterium]
MADKSVIARHRGAFRAVVRATVPAASDLDPPAWERVEAVVEDALSRRPPGVLRQLGLFLRLLGVFAVVRYGQGFSRLSPLRCRALLRRLERSRYLLLRRGVWGVRTLAFMGYYGRAEVRGSLGYHAHPDGWSARGRDAGPWPDREGAGAPEEMTLTASRAAEPPDARGFESHE